MQALSNIQVLNNYKVEKIITACPHCYNTLKNEYPALGGSYEVIHHSELLVDLINTHKGNIHPAYKGKTITYHDSCYLGRSNGIFEAPRAVLKVLEPELIEMKRNRAEGLCCGAGGAQMFKDSEPGNKDINIERAEEALQTEAKVIATACPFCMTMLSDGVKIKEQDKETQVMDIVELFKASMDK
jgi:Fe-S oxidoreductase